jgi:hypothetical protein
MSTSVPLNSPTPATSAPPASPDQAPIWDRAVGALKTEVAPILDIAKSVVTPPQDHKELIAHAVGGLPALETYRAARAVVNGLENTIKAPAEKYKQATEDFQRGVQEMQNKDYRNLASSAASTAADIMGATAPGTGFITDRAREFSEGARPGGDIVTPLVKTGVDVGTAVAGEFLGKTPFRTTETTPSIVGKITQATGSDVETAARALKSVDTTGIETYQDLDKTLDSQIKANTAKVDASLSQNGTPYKPADLETRIPVAGKTDIVTNPVNDALDQLHDYYLKTKDATGQAQIESLQTKFESQGLTTKELNDLARLHGKDLNAYNANGELASGLTKQAAENTRMGVKDLVRKLTPDDATQALDKNTSDLIATRQMASDMSAKVQALQNRLEKAGFWRKAASAAATGTDIVTGGFFKNLLGLAKTGDQSLSVVQVENNLRKNLALLDQLNTMTPQTAFQTLKSMVPAATRTAVVMPKSTTTPGE